MPISASGHGAIDGGAGYTYFDPTKGHDLLRAGLTYNFINTDTQYKNGIDCHSGWGASQFLSKELLVGLVGYAYQQLTCDSGSGNRAGLFRVARVQRVGPQSATSFRSDQYRHYLGLKGY